MSFITRYDALRLVRACCLCHLSVSFPGGSEVKASASNAGDLGLIPGWGRSPGERESEVAQSYTTLCDPMDCSLPGSTVYGIFQAMAPHSSILAWRIPWTEKPGGLQSMESQSQTRLHVHFLTAEYTLLCGCATICLLIWLLNPIQLSSFVEF